MGTESTGKWVQYGIIAFGLLPLMPNALTALLPLNLFAASAAWYIQTPKVKIDWQAFCISASLFLAYACSLSYSADLEYAIKRLGPAAWIVTFPVVFQLFLAGYRIDAKIPLRVLSIFTASTLAYLVIFGLYLTQVDRPENPYLDFPTANFFRNALTEIPLIDRHPIYLSVFLSISILFTAYRITFGKNRSKNRRYFQLLSLAALFIGLIAIQGKGALIYLSLAFPLLLFGSPAQRKSLLIYYVSALAVLFILMAVNPDSNNRFKELLTRGTYVEQEIDPYNSSQMRMAIWSTATACIREAPLLGYGIGDVQQVLNEKYKAVSPVLLEKQYNSHNQFLGIWLGTGIIGLSLFLIFLVYTLRAIWRSGEYLWFSVLFFLALNLFTENLIDRQLGALTFFFLFNLFLAARPRKPFLTKTAEIDNR